MPIWKSIYLKWAWWINVPYVFKRHNEPHGMYLHTWNRIPQVSVLIKRNMIEHIRLTNRVIGKKKYDWAYKINK